MRESPLSKTALTPPHPACSRYLLIPYLTDLCAASRVDRGGGGGGIVSRADAQRSVSASEPIRAATAKARFQLAHARPRVCVKAAPASQITGRAMLPIFQQGAVLTRLRPPPLTGLASAALTSPGTPGSAVFQKNVQVRTVRSSLSRDHQGGAKST